MFGFNSFFVERNKDKDQKGKKKMMMMRERERVRETSRKLSTRIAESQPDRCNRCGGASNLTSSHQFVCFDHRGQHIDNFGRILNVCILIREAVESLYEVSLRYLS